MELINKTTCLDCFNRKKRLLRWLAININGHIQLLSVAFVTVERFVSKRV